MSKLERVVDPEEARIEAEATGIVEWLKRNNIVTVDYNNWLELVEKCKVEFVNMGNPRVSEPEAVIFEFVECGKRIEFFKQEQNSIVSVILTDNSNTDLYWELLNVKSVDPSTRDRRDEWTLTTVSANKGRLMMSNRQTYAHIS